jgi:hypothetical protein
VVTLAAEVRELRRRRGGAQSCVAKTAGFDSAGVDRGLLDGRVAVQQVWEEVRPAAVMGGDESGFKRSPDGAGAVQAMALQPAPEEDIPGKCGLNPLAAKLRKPGAGMRGVADLVMKAPVCGCLIQALRDPLDDDDGAAGSEHVANVVENNAGSRDVVQRKAGDHGIQRSIWHVVLEGDPSIFRSLRRLGIDTHGLRVPAAAVRQRRAGRGSDGGDFQDYVRTADEGRYQRYDYAAPVFDFAGRLVYDESGLVLDYPGIAVRAV